MPGTGNYIPYQHNDDNIILGWHQAVKDGVVWIWVSKKNEMNMWSVLEHKIDNSDNTKEKLWHKDILDDAMKLVEDNWLIFVTDNEISKIIGDILDYTLLVWLEGGEKENFLMRMRQSGDAGEITTETINQLEERKQRFEQLRFKVIERRVCDETKMIRSEREERLHELYYNGNDPRMI
jgi:hypothetical protein